MGTLKSLSPPMNKGAVRIRCASAAECCLAAFITGDGVIGPHSTIAPATDSEFFRVGRTLLHQVVHACDEILDFLVTPVGGDRAREGVTSSAAAAVVDAEDHETTCGQQLPLELIPVKCKRAIVLQVGAPVY